MGDYVDCTDQKPDNGQRPLAESELPQLPSLASQQSLVVQKRRKNPLATPKGILLCTMTLLIVSAGVIFTVIKSHVPSGREKWSYQLGNQMDSSSPTVSNGIVYIGDEENTVYALDAASGHVIWFNQLGKYTDIHQATSSGIVPSPVVMNGIVYANSQNNYLYALDARTGRNLWSSEMPYVAMSTPVVANGIVYIGTEDGTLYAFDAVSGRKIWSVQKQNFYFINVSPAVDKGVIYVAGFEGEVYTLDAVSGREKWDSLIKGSDAGSYSPVVVNGTVYITTISGQLAALDAITGREKWSSSQVGGFTSSPVVVGNTIYVYSYAGVFAWDTASDHIRWFHSMSGAGTLSAPAVVNGTVYVGTANRAVAANGGIRFQSDDTLYALDAASGSEQWFYQLGGGSDSTPAVSNGVVYAGADNGTLYALLPPG